MYSKALPAKRWSPYWANPLITGLMVVGVSIIMFIAIPEETFLRQFREGKVDTSFVVTLHILASFVFFSFIALGILLASAAYPRSRTGAVDGRTLQTFCATACFLSLVGYVIYFASSKASLGVYLSALKGSAGATYVMKGSFEKVPGVTSFMNLACWWYVYIAHVFIVEKRKKLSGIELCSTFILTALCLVRAFAVNERRVIFEIAVPAVLYVVLFNRNWTASQKRIINSAPIYGVIMVVIVFMVTEYFRSWVNFFSDGRAGVSYIEFALSRLGGYYVTAMNNGAHVMENQINLHGYLTFGGVMKMPLVADVGGLKDLRQRMLYDYMAALQRFANPEFNNPGGVISPIVDFGYVLGCFILAAFGVFFGFFYRSASSGNLFGFLLYASFFFGVLEITRIWYVGTANAIINILFVVIYFGIRAGMPGRVPGR